MIVNHIYTYTDIWFIGRVSEDILPVILPDNMTPRLVFYSHIQFPEPNYRLFIQQGILKEKENRETLFFIYFSPSILN